MAFFGITNLGYQNSIGDYMIVNPRGASQSQDVRSSRCCALSFKTCPYALRTGNKRRRRGAAIFDSAGGVLDLDTKSYKDGAAANSRCSPTQSGLPPLPPLQVPQGPLKCTDICTVYNQPLPYSPDIHSGSQERYKEMLKWGQTPRSPNQLYSTPLTGNQLYGWLISSEKSPESWTQVKRFPKKNSEMTKFVRDMSMTDREFSLF